MILSFVVICCPWAGRVFSGVMSLQGYVLALGGAVIDFAKTRAEGDNLKRARLGAIAIIVVAAKSFLVDVVATHPSAHHINTWSAGLSLSWYLEQPPLGVSPPRCC